jgi:hypothetical protein
VAKAGECRQLGETAVRMMHNGTLVEKGLLAWAMNDHITRRLHGHHEPQEELVFADILERIPASEDAPTMAEVGRWWAYYSLWFVRRSPSGSVVTLEPDLPYLEASTSNFARASGLFVHGAIGDALGTDFEFSAASDGQTRAVREYALRKLIGMPGIESVMLLLTDVRGAETAPIEQSRQMLAGRRVRFRVVSTHHWTISGDALTHQRVLDTIRELGGHIVAEHTISESYSGDGLVAASFDLQDAEFVVELSRARPAESLSVELEYELVSAHRRRRVLEDDLQQQRSTREAAETQLEACEQRRNWRYSALPRRPYRRVTATRNLERASTIQGAARS